MAAVIAEDAREPFLQVAAVEKTFEGLGLHGSILRFRRMVGSSYLMRIRCVTVGSAQITPPLPIKKCRSQWDRLFSFPFSHDCTS